MEWIVEAGMSNSSTGFAIDVDCLLKSHLLLDIHTHRSRKMIKTLFLKGNSRTSWGFSPHGDLFALAHGSSAAQKSLQEQIVAMYNIVQYVKNKFRVWYENILTIFRVVSKPVPTVYPLPSILNLIPQFQLDLSSVSTETQISILISSSETHF